MERGCPRGVFAGASTIVEVVDVAHNGQPRKGGEAQGKEARQVAVLGADTGLGIEHKPYFVLFLQVHVHDQLLLIDFQAGKFVEIAFLLIHFHVLHHVRGHVVEHELAVFVEKVLAVEQQLFDVATVDVNFAAFAHLNTGQLTDDGIEHRPFGQGKGIGIVNHRVAFLIEHHFAGCDGGLPQLILAGSALHVSVLKGDKFKLRLLRSDGLFGYIDAHRLIALFAETHNVGLLGMFY